MGIYENIDIDFAKRTLRIMEQYDNHIPSGPDNYEVTLLINCLVGLLILPQQRRYNVIPETPIDNLVDWHIDNTFINNWGTDRNGNIAPRNLRELVRRLRNSVAHFRIEVEGTETDIEKLKFSDKNGFRATIPVDNLRMFVRRFASEISSNETVS